MRVISLFFVCICLLITPAHAAVSETAARDFINKIGGQTVDILADKAASAAQKDQKLNKMFRSTVDVGWISRFVLGKNLRSASEEQKKRYMAAYEIYVINTYTSRFRDYTGEQVKVVDTKPQDDNVVVNTLVVRPAAENINLQFLVRADKKGAPMIYDVVIEGISQLNTQRAEFDAIVARDGLDGLIAMLEKRTSSLTGETASPAPAPQF